MDERQARFRISVDGSEIEIDGSEAFVREHLEKFGDILRSVRDRPPLEAVAEQTVASESVAPSMVVPVQFGEYLARFPKSITDVDRVLIAGHFVQTQSADKAFRTGEANSLLKEQGIKVANASNCITRNKKTGRVFSVAGRKYRISQAGLDWINQTIAG